jgi:hypothetical protein
MAEQLTLVLIAGTGDDFARYAGILINILIAVFRNYDCRAHPCYIPRGRRRLRLWRLRQRGMQALWRIILPAAFRNPHWRQRACSSKTSR